MRVSGSPSRTDPGIIGQKGFAELLQGRDGAASVEYYASFKLSTLEPCM